MIKVTIRKENQQSLSSKVNFMDYMYTAQVEITGKRIGLQVSNEFIALFP